MRRLASALGSLAIATLLSAPALADCVPGTQLCASAGVAAGIPVLRADGQISVGIPNIVLPFPAPQAAPPPAAPAEPMPYAEAPQYGYAPQARHPRHVYRVRPTYPASRLALDLRVDGAMGAGRTATQHIYGVGGAGIGLRYRAVPHFGLELGFDVLGGRDFNDRKRLEFVGSAGGLLYVNPRSRAQFYFSGGMIADSAKATPYATTLQTNDFVQRDQHYTHLGGYGGVGLEMFATRHLAFHLDVRGLVRQRLGGEVPEFTDPGTGRTTNTSGGVVGSAGALFYF
jgi:hypothetical protein